MSDQENEPDITRPGVPEELKTVEMEIAERVAMKSPAHMKRWAEETGREFVLMRTDHLIDGLPFPGGVEAFIQIVESYQQHRRSMPEYETVCLLLDKHKPGRKCWMCGGDDKVALLVRSSKLTLAELYLAREWLEREIATKEVARAKYLREHPEAKEVKT